MIRCRISASSRLEKGVRGSFFFSSRRRHTRLVSDWSSDVCSSDLQAQLSGWCSDQGHGLRWEDGAGAAQAMAIVARGGAQAGRWRGAAQTGRSDARSGGDAVAAQAQPSWGLAARGAQVEAGAPAFHFRLSNKLQRSEEHTSELQSLTNLVC